MLGGRQVPRDIEERQTSWCFQSTTELPFEMEVTFESGSFTDRPNRLDGDSFKELLEEHVAAFYKKFDKTFDLD